MAVDILPAIRLESAILPALDGWMIMDVIRPRCHGWAYEMALSVREAFALRDIPTDEELERVLDGLQIEVVERELPSELAEVLSDDVLILRTGLSRARRRWVIAHAIGHHLGHAGCQPRIVDALRWRQERQADVFAGFLLMGLPQLQTARSAWDAAESFGLPLDCVVQWLGWLAS